MAKHVGIMNCRVVGPGFESCAGKDTFYSMLFSYVLDGTLCR